MFETVIIIILLGFSLLYTDTVSTKRFLNEDDGYLLGLKEKDYDKAVEKSKDQEKELQMKVQELNKLHKELEIQQAEILDQNRELQEKERLQAKALLDADKNLERARVKIMAEFVRNLERQSLAMDKAEEKLRSQDNVPKESIATLHEVNSEFKILISKYKLD